MSDAPDPTKPPIPAGGQLRWERRWRSTPKYLIDSFSPTMEWVPYLVLQQWCITPEGFQWVDVPIKDTPMPTETPQ